MGNISKNFSFTEFEHSVKAEKNGINNSIPEQVKPAIRALVLSILQPLRDYLRVPIIIESGYRCERLNELVGGAKNSQHRKGQASDIRSVFFTPLSIARRIVALQLPFDQLILYSTFVHVSHKVDGNQRGQILYDKSYKGEKI